MTSSKKLLVRFETRDSGYVTITNLLLLFLFRFPNDSWHIQLCFTCRRLGVQFRAGHGMRRSFLRWQQLHESNARICLYRTSNACCRQSRESCSFTRDYESPSCLLPIPLTLYLSLSFDFNPIDAPLSLFISTQEACGGCPASPINPDTKGNFSEYRSRLHSVSLFAGANAGSNNNIYYSFNQGITHFIVFSAEAYIYAVDKTFLSNQLAFMTKDLAAVDRKVTPWVVALVHKDWTMEADAFKDFAPILDKGGVDILFCGHVSFILLLCLVSVFNLHISNTSCLVI
jgi:hypothetical protein